MKNLLKLLMVNAIFTSCTKDLEVTPSTAYTINADVLKDGVYGGNYNFLYVASITTENNKLKFIPNNGCSKSIEACNAYNNTTYYFNGVTIKTKTEVSCK